MKKLIIGAAAAAAMLIMAMPVGAATTTINVDPSSTVYDSKNVVGVPGDYAPGYEYGSLASNGVSKTDMYFSPEMLFGKGITLGDIKNFSYYTKKGTLHSVNAADWFLNIYTKPYIGDVSTATWYGDRIGTEPYFAININDPINIWNQWSTNGSSNKLRFFESTAGAPGATFGSYSDPDWDTFIAGNALSGSPYADHEVLWVSVQTASGWASGFTGKIDGLRVELKDGSVAKVNFESFKRSAEITSPTSNETVSGVVPFDAVLTDEGHNDTVQWAVRKGTCAAGVKNVIGNVDGSTYDFTWDGTNFHASADTTAWEDGQYCFIFNPSESLGDAPIRETSEFTVNNTPDNKEQCKNGGWEKFYTPQFKNQGDCVSWLQSSPKAKGNTK